MMKQERVTVVNMCVVSMIIDYYKEKPQDWWEMRSNPVYPWPVANPKDILRAKELLEEMEDLYNKAKQYDIRNNEPNCERESKKKELLDKAAKYGIKIGFLE